MATYDGIDGVRPRPTTNKLPVRVATTANIADLAAGAPDTVDGVPLVAGDRILVKDQGTTSLNGIYYVETLGTGADGTWERARDWIDGEKDYALAGANAYVQQGSVNAEKTFTMTTSGGAGFPTIGTTGLLWFDLDVAIVSGPGSSTDTAIPKWSGTTGTNLADSTILIDGSGNIVPSVNDSNALGTSSLKWSDLFLASGAVVNFNSGDVTLTHAANVLTFAGATTGYVFNDGPLRVGAGILTLDNITTLPVVVGSTGRLWVAGGQAPSQLAFLADSGATVGIPGSWQIAILHDSQRGITSAQGNIRQATLFHLTTQPAGGDLFSITDGTTTRTYGATSGGDVQYTIGGTASITLDNLVAAINGDGSSLWDSVHIGDFTGFTSNGIVIVYRTSQAATSYADRIYGDSNFVTSTSAMYMRFDQEPDYRKAGDENFPDEALPTSDPGAKRFGPGRHQSAMFSGDVVVGVLDGTVKILDRSANPDTWTSIGGGGGIGGSTGATDNAMLRADGTGGSTVQSSGVLVDDSNNVSGVASLVMGEIATPASPGAATGRFYVKSDTPSNPAFQDDQTSAGEYSLIYYSPTKRPCRLATTGNVANTASGAPDTVDGVSVALNDRILVWQQTTGAQNGIYQVDTVGTGADGVWSRTGDWTPGNLNHVEAGLETYVQAGSIWGRTRFTLVTTGAIVIGTTATEFIPEGGLARTDASSTEIIASTAFTNGTFVVNDSGFTDMRDHSEIAVFFLPSSLGTNTIVDIVVFWSDDGTTIPFATDDYTQQTDFDIVNQADGSFNPKSYTARLTTAGSELVANQGVHLTFPKGGGACKVGVKGDAADGAFSVRVQRLVR